MRAFPRTWHGFFWAPNPPLTPFQRGFRGPMLGVILILLAFNIGFIMYLGPLKGVAFDGGNMSVSIMLLVQNLATLWIREGQRGLMMRMLSLIVTGMCFIFITIVVIQIYRNASDVVRNEPISPSAAIIQQAQTAYAALFSYESRGEATTIEAGKPTKVQFTIRLQRRPDLYRITWNSSECHGVTWSDGTGDFLEINGTVTKEKDRFSALGHASEYAEMEPDTISKTFFNDGGNQIRPSSIVDERKPDEKIGDIPCYVITTDTKYSATGRATYWIGKKDGLIHKCESTLTTAATPPESDADLMRYLKSANKPSTPEAIKALRVVIAKSIARMEKKMPVDWIQTQTQIVLNKPFSPSDFAH